MLGHFTLNSSLRDSFEASHLHAMAKSKFAHRSRGPALLLHVVVTLLLVGGYCIFEADVVHHVGHVLKNMKVPCSVKHWKEPIPSPKCLKTMCT